MSSVKRGSIIVASLVKTIILMVYFNDRAGGHQDNQEQVPEEPAAEDGGIPEKIDHRLRVVPELKPGYIMT